MTQPQLSQEEAHRMAIVTMGWQCNVLIRLLAEKFGSEETQRMIYPYFKEMGKRAAARLPEMGITGRDATAFGDWIDFIEREVLKVEGKLTEVGPDRVVKDITSCPLQHLSEDLCKAFQGQIDGIIEEINPDYEWFQTRTIPGGSQTCQWVIRRK